MNKPKQTKMTQEEKEIQVKRFFAQKREAYFQMILANILQNIHLEVVDIKMIVDASLEGADYALEKLFPIPTEDKEDE